MEDHEAEQVEHTEKAIDKYPQLKPLMDFNGSEVEFHHNGKTYLVSSLGKDLTPDIKFIFFGLWEKAEGKLTPVGYSDNFYLQNKQLVKSNIKTHHLHINPIPENFNLLDQVEMTEKDFQKENPRYAAFVIDKKYRQTRVADILFAQVLVVSEALGAQKYAAESDSTIRSSEDPAYLPQFKTDISGLITEQHHTSFASRYATQHEIISVEDDKNIEEGSPMGGKSTIISTHISSYQEHLLNQAFKK